MAASRYKKFLQLCEKWPVDKSKDIRDLGTFLRKRVLETFSKGEASAINVKECDETFESLQKLANNFHKRKWPRIYESNATGCTAESLNYSLSTKGLADFTQENKKGILEVSKDKLKFFNRPSSSDSGQSPTSKK